MQKKKARVVIRTCNASNQHDLDASQILKYVCEYQR